MYIRNFFYDKNNGKTLLYTLEKKRSLYNIDIATEQTRLSHHRQCFPCPRDEQDSR